MRQESATRQEIKKAEAEQNQRLKDFEAAQKALRDSGPQAGIDLGMG